MRNQVLSNAMLFVAKPTHVLAKQNLIPPMALLNRNSMTDRQRESWCFPHCCLSTLATGQ